MACGAPGDMVTCSAKNDSGRLSRYDANVSPSVFRKAMSSAFVRGFDSSAVNF